MSANPYVQPPPQYDAVIDTNHGPSRTVLEAPDEADVPDDFKYGACVAQSSREIRYGFIRQVYGAFLVQVAVNAVMAALLRTPEAFQLFVGHQYLVLVLMLASFGSFFALWWKRKSYPLNVALLALFTLSEATMVGIATAMYDAQVVVQAFALTSVIFAGLTLFTLQTKYDFSSWMGLLNGALWLLLGVLFIQFFVPFSSAVQLGISVVSAALFCGFILVDTQHIMNTLHPDEWIIGCIELYLDFVNLFLNILRILGYLQNDNNN